MLVSFTSVIIGLVIVMIADIFRGSLSFWIILVPIILLLPMLFITGLIWLPSLANLVLPDIQQVLSYLMMVQLIESPIDTRLRCFRQASR